MFTYFWDIETSKIICDNGEEMQVTYLSNVLKMNYETGEIISSIFHRTIEEVVEYFNTLEDDIIVWSHNLDYELTFLLRELGESKGEYKYNRNEDKWYPIDNYSEVSPGVFSGSYYDPYRKELL